MAKSLNTGDALYSALSHLFCVDDDNTIKELKASLACTPHANVLLPGTGATSSPVGRSFRTGGAAGSSPAVYGVDFPNYVASNAADISFFCAVNQYNSANNGGASAYGVPMFGTDSGGIRIGVGMQLDAATGKVFHNNTNGIAALSGTLNTTDDITSGVTSFGFTRTAAGVVKVFINGVVDSAYSGGIANTGSQFGAAWGTAEHSLIGGFAGYGWASFDFAYVCDFLGTIVSEADMLRLHNSLTGSDTFALVTLPAAATPVFSGTIPTLTGTQGSALAVQSPTIASYFSGSDITYTVSTALPTGLSISSTTGVISGTPSTDTDWSGYVTATNSGGAVNSNTFAITIAAASGDTTPPVLTGVITINTDSETTTGWQASWPVGTDDVAMDGYVISTDGGATYPIVWAVNNYTFDGYAPGTTYQLRVKAKDTSGNLSTPAIEGTVTTLGDAVAVPAGAFLIKGGVTVLGEFVILP